MGQLDTSLLSLQMTNNVQVLYKRFWVLLTITQKYQL